MSVRLSQKIVYILYFPASEHLKYTFDHSCSKDTGFPVEDRGSSLNAEANLYTPLIFIAKTTRFQKTLGRDV